MALKDWFLGNGKSKDDASGVRMHSSPAQHDEDYVHPTQMYNIPVEAPNFIHSPASVTPAAKVSKPAYKDASQDTAIGNKQNGVVNGFDDITFPNPIPTVETVASLKASSKPVSGIPAYPGRTWPDTPAYKTPTLPQKEVIAFIIESSADVLKYKKEVLTILNNIVESKKTALFLFAKIGDGGKFFELVDHSALTSNNFVESLLNSKDSAKRVSLAEAMFHVKSVFKKQLSPSFDFKEVQYITSTYSVICIGGGSAIQTDFEKRVVMSCIDDFKELPKLKSIKYFCVKDSDAVYAASLGFPTIGHIISNFYE